MINWGSLLITLALIKMRQICLAIILTTLFRSVVTYGQSAKEWSSVDYTTKEVRDMISINNATDYKVFLHGETHNMASNPETHWAFLMYYYQNANVRNLLLEDGYAGAYLANKYLESGDLSYICKNVHYVLHQEDRVFWQKLYDFNSPVEEKIKIVAIDDNERLATWFKAIEVLFSDKDYQDKQIDEIIAVSKGITNPLRKDDDKLRNLKQTCVNNFNNNLHTYLNILKEDSIHLKLILKNDASIDRNKHTNRIMFENLNRIAQSGLVNKGGFFGQFGSAHVVNNSRSLSHILNTSKNSPFVGKVMTVLPCFENCQFSWLSVENDSIITKIYPEKSKLKVKNPYSNSSYTLIELKNKAQNPNKYILYIRNRGGMAFKAPDKCE